MKQMQEVQEMEQEAILPEGYTAEDDYFEDDNWGGREPAETEAAEQPGTEETQPAQETERDLRAEAEAFFAQRPGSQMPETVLDAWLGGMSLSQAYAQHEAQICRAESWRLARENQVLRQNAEAAGRAPVRGVNGGGDTRPEPEDPFLSGFNDERW